MPRTRSSSVDASLIAGLLGTRPLRPDPYGPPHRPWWGEGDTSYASEPTLRTTTTLLAAEEPERTPAPPGPASGCGHVLHVGGPPAPKGVVYSHRSTFLHTMAITSGCLSRESTRGTVYSSIVPDVPRQRLGHPLRGVHDRGRPDHAPAVPPGCPRWACHDRALTDRPSPGGVPTIWSDLSRYARRPVDSPVVADDHGGRCRGAPLSSSSGSVTTRGRDGPGLGHDRDQPAVLVGHPAPPARLRKRR